MSNRPLPVWPEAWPFIGLCALAALSFALLEWPCLAVVFLGLTGVVGHLFRDPERVPPEDAESAVAPVDGRLRRVDRATDPASGEVRLRLSIVPGPLDMRVLRFPVSGKVERIFSGRDEENEELFPPMRHVVEIVGKGNQRVVVAANAAPLFRKLTTVVEKGDKLKRGDRFGYSAGRVDVYLPDGFEARVPVGEKVRAGETELAVRAPGQ